MWDEGKPALPSAFASPANPATRTHCIRRIARVKVEWFFILETSFLEILNSPITYFYHIG
jgi:hypothetical protein